jgi:hypothetical protein
MPIGSEDARIQAEAIIKAACIRAAADLIIGGQLAAASPRHNLQEAVALYGMEIWNTLQNPNQ